MPCHAMYDDLFGGTGTGESWWHKCHRVAGASSEVNEYLLKGRLQKAGQHPEAHNHECE